MGDGGPMTKHSCTHHVDCRADLDRLCPYCLLVQAKLQKTGADTLTFRRAMEIADECGLLTDSMRQEWLQEKIPETVCALCHRLIGWNCPYGDSPLDGGLVHANCFQKAEEEGRADTARLQRHSARRTDAPCPRD